MSHKKTIFQSILIALLAYNWFVGLVPALIFGFAVCYLPRLIQARFASRLLATCALLITVGLTLILTAVINSVAPGAGLISLSGDPLAFTFLVGGVAFVTGLAAATFHLLRMRTALIITALSMGLGIGAIAADSVIRFPFDTQDIPSSLGILLASYGVFMLLIAPVRAIYLWRERRGDRAKGTTAMTAQPPTSGHVPAAPALSPEERLVSSAKFRLAALSQRDDPTSITYAAQFSQAISLSDHGGMSAVLRDERAALIETTLSGLRPYQPSGGRPEMMELSDYLQRQAQSAASPEQQAIFEAGIAGETLVVERLEGMLDESWSIVSGYQNARGETDVMVIGTYGLCALEIKNYQGVINVQGSDWIRTRYDRFGNRIPGEAPAPIQDAGGRSPADQGQPDRRRPRDRVGPTLRLSDHHSPRCRSDPRAL